jgi:hypothetical protein
VQSSWWKYFAFDESFVLLYICKTLGDDLRVFELEKGYVVQRIYEVWHFDETEQYDPKTKTGGLFADYVNTFFKMNFPQKLFSISLANALNPGLFCMLL